MEWPIPFIMDDCTSYSIRCMQYRIVLETKDAFLRAASIIHPSACCLLNMEKKGGLRS